MRVPLFEAAVCIAAGGFSEFVIKAAKAALEPAAGFGKRCFMVPSC